MRIHRKTTQAETQQPIYGQTEEVTVPPKYLLVLKAVLALKQGTVVTLPM
jgi:hypothetical protein